MKTTIGIFQGKEAANNKFLLEALYDCGPLTAWELTKAIRERNRMSLHAIFNKRLRILEKKGYVQRVAKKWTLQFKGIIAVLIIQSQPKPWNEEWTQIFENYVKPLERTPKKYAIVEDGKEIADITKFAKHVPIALRRFEGWVALASWIKEKMDEGFINLDVIKNKSLLALIMSEFDDSLIRNVGNQYGLKFNSSLGEKNNGSC